MNKFNMNSRKLPKSGKPITSLQHHAQLTNYLNSTRTILIVSQAIYQILRFKINCHILVHSKLLLTHCSELQEHNQHTLFYFLMSLFNINTFTYLLTYLLLTYFLLTYLLLTSYLLTSYLLLTYFLLTYLLTSYLLLTYFLLTYLLLTFLLTPWSIVLLEMLTGFQLVKKFPTFYGNRKFITAFTSARHLSLS